MYDFVQVVENVIYFYWGGMFRFAIVRLDNGRYITTNGNGHLILDSLPESIFLQYGLGSWMKKF